MAFKDTFKNAKEDMAKKTKGKKGKSGKGMSGGKRC